MVWKQLKDTNWRVGYLGGWCEGYVSMAWGFSKFTYNSKGNVIGTQGNGQGKTNYPSATAHWKANLGNHPNQEPPLGITVPVFFSLGNVPEGHVAIRLDDGTVASSTQAGYRSQGFLHPNLKHLIETYAPGNGGCKYLGWSEYVAGVHIVENTAKGGAIEEVTKEQSFQECFITQSGRWATAAEVSTWQKSGIPAYTWVQKNAPHPSKEQLNKKIQEFADFQARAEKEMSQLSKDIISFKVDKESAEAAQQRAKAHLASANTANAELRASIEQRAQELASQGLEHHMDEVFKTAYLTQTGEYPPAKMIEEWKRTDMTADKWVRANVRNDLIHELQGLLDHANNSVRTLIDQMSEQAKDIADLATRIDDVSAQVAEESKIRAVAEEALEIERRASEDLRNKLAVASQQASPIAEWSMVQLVTEAIKRLVGQGVNKQQDKGGSDEF